jgi:hypothetical protein
MHQECRRTYGSPTRVHDRRSEHGRQVPTHPKHLTFTNSHQMLHTSSPQRRYTRCQGKPRPVHKPARTPPTSYRRISAHPAHVVHGHHPRRCALDLPGSRNVDFHHRPGGDKPFGVLEAVEPKARHCVGIVGEHRHPGLYRVGKGLRAEG